MEVKIETWMLKQAVEWFHDMIKDGRYNKGRAADPVRQYQGLLGQAVVWSQYPWLIPTNGPVSADFRFAGFGLDVKTKHCSVNPQPHHHANICVAQSAADFYMFVRLHELWEKAWIVGCISRETLLAKVREGKATVRKAGEWNDNYQFQYDEYEITHDELYPPEVCMDWLRKRGYQA